MSPIAASDLKAPPAITHNSSVQVVRSTNALPANLLNAARSTLTESFDAEKHVCFEAPGKIYKMEELGFPGRGISETAVSAPFPLFSQSAVAQMRKEVFSQRVLDECRFSSGFVKDTVRGMMPSRAPFTYDAWKSTEVLAAVSAVAGVDLVPVMDMEISAINISVNPTTVTDAEKAASNDRSAFAWHYDSYPFVCVTMLSDCTDMQGGETAVKTASGDIMKVRGPAMGTAVIMQGRYLNHAALKAFGGKERISQITSLRPRFPLAKDESVLTGVRPISNTSDLYTQWTQYRLENLEERIREKLKSERTRESFNRPFDLVATRSWFEENIAYFQATLKELQEVQS
ncbi:hypothetical protein BU24DRAFT_485106 [Aaosphaeria arxii CBS 175.79]|uniref:Fe2OG dioxygenase domain-containing protein n=1 Tax=Aaosphaeria arxii CBS 175.79 TaxID=1450172 RepID=A0A6A5XG35_9PLEO|nr:uncharacterized protein BU24DRAFT_485106 [Aaosphaeria arxii CBS 175.79]KAF2011819.1 hypothetical protein BU24DRAFT_485106 [Aaosphaeria arxii CBS 175.79]